MQSNIRAILEEYVVPTLTELGYTKKYFKDGVGEGFWFTYSAPDQRFRITVDILHKWERDASCIRFEIASLALFEFFRLAGMEGYIDKYYFSTEEELIEWIELLLPFLVKFEALLYKYDKWVVVEAIREQRSIAKEKDELTLGIIEWSAIRAKDVREDFLIIDKRCEEISFINKQSDIK